MAHSEMPMHDQARQITKSDHILSRLDPRVKFLSYATLLVMAISCRGFFLPVLLTAVSIAFCIDLGVRPKSLLIHFAEPLFIAFMVVLLKLFFSGTVPLFSMHLLGIDWVGHRDGLRAGLLIAARMGGAVSLTALLGFSTPFTELLGALAWLRVPWGFIEISLFAWRYLFVLLDDAETIYAAQKNRLGYAGIMRGARSFGTLAGALVIKAFDNSKSIATAMEQRGYDGTMPLMRQKPFNYLDMAVFLLILTGMGIIWWI